jgi:hypothetical protein
MSKLSNLLGSDNDATAVTVTETGNTTEGRYRKWSDGTIEQWIYIPQDGTIPNPGTYSFTLPTPMLIGIDYVSATPIRSGGVSGGALMTYWTGTGPANLTQVQIFVDDSSSSNPGTGVSIYIIGDMP